jgi:peptidoglycan-associated lipoprotein
MMKQGMISLLAALSMAALMAGGCASNETVKAEEPAPATVKAEAPKVETAQPEAPATVTETAKPIAEAPKQAEAQAIAPVEAALETAYFDFDKSELRQDTREVLSKNAEFLLKVKPDTKIRIEGNCDERGSAEYNLALGERRAKSALQYLLTLGVKADRMSVISYGKEKPAVQGSTEEAWAKNRRADFVIIK